MKPQRQLTKSALAVVFGALVLAASSPAHADTTWTDWSSANPVCPPGATCPPSALTFWLAAGTMGSINVVASGDFFGLAGPGGDANVPIFPGSAVPAGYPEPAQPASSIWDPSTSWTGGPVTNAPPTSYDSVAVYGNMPQQDEIAFTNPVTGAPVFVTDPVVAIWSLGALAVPNAVPSPIPATTAEFIFTAPPGDPAEPFTIIAGGPDAPWGGSSITDTATNSNCPANTVCGEEGNGTVEFLGAYNAIYFTTPDSEYYYTFTAGMVSAVPEPETLSLLGLGLLALPLLRASLARRRRRA